MCPTEGNVGSGSPYFEAEFGQTGAVDGQEIDRARGDTERRWGCLLSVCIPRATEVECTSVQQGSEYRTKQMFFETDVE